MYLVKTYKKVYEKLLTKTKRGDNICKHSTRESSERAEKEDAFEKEKVLKKLEKTFKKVLTKGYAI